MFCLEISRNPQKMPRWSFVNYECSLHPGRLVTHEYTGIHYVIRKIISILNLLYRKTIQIKQKKQNRAARTHTVHVDRLHFLVIHKYGISK